MNSLINIVGDIHNFKSLKNILNQFDNLISLGDIAAVKKEEFFNNIKKYKNTWKAFSEKDINKLKKEDIEWFKSINIDGWIKQLDTIKKSNKKIIINMGNSDFSMINFFPECKEYLKNIKNPNLEFIQKLSIKNFDNIQVIFIPYGESIFNIEDILKKIEINKPLFILAHCPAFKDTNKKYYIKNYNILKSISKIYKNKLYYIHGHVHADNSYKYSQKELSNVIFLTPKAEENRNGIGINHHIIQVNTKNGNIELVDSKNDKFTSFLDLPEEFYTKEEHWNYFKYDII